MVYDLATGTQTYLNIHKEGLKIRSVYFSDAETAWFTARRQGLYAYYKDSLYTLPVDKNGFLNSSHCILEDKNGYFWISSNHGVFQALKSDLEAYIKGTTKTVYYYLWGLNDGIEGYELNGSCKPCGIKLSSGKFSFPALNGVVQFDPLQTKPILPIKPISISAFRLNERDTVLAKNITLEAGSELLEFQISAPYFGEKANNSYIEYHLVGLHKKWHSLRDDGLISIDNLSHGNYVLQVRRIRGFGVDNYTLVEFPFNVAKFYYETLWFRIGFGVVLLMIIGILFYIRFRLARRRRRELEAVIREKTKDYRVLNSRLKENLNELKLSQQALKKILEDKDRMMGIYAHDIRGPLRHMVYMAERNDEKAGELESDEIKRWFKVFAQTANGIYEQTERMFHWISGQSNGMQLEQMRIPVRDIVFESTRFFQNQANTKGIEFVNLLSEDIWVVSDPNILRIAINNIIDNAIKFTESGIIEFSALENKERILINIKDSGIGIDEERLAQLNDGVYSSSLGTANEVGKGFGLSAIKKLLSEMGGAIRLDSTLGSGTTVSLFLPKREMFNPEDVI